MLGVLSYSIHAPKKQKRINIYILYIGHLCSSSQIHSSFTYVEVQNKQNKRYLEPPPSSSTNNSSQSNPLTSHLILAAAVDLLGVRPTHVPVVSPPVAVEGLRGGALNSHPRTSSTSLLGSTLFLSCQAKTRLSRSRRQ